MASGGGSTSRRSSEAARSDQRTERGVGPRVRRPQRGVNVGVPRGTCACATWHTGRGHGRTLKMRLFTAASKCATWHTWLSICSARRLTRVRRAITRECTRFATILLPNTQRMCRNWPPSRTGRSLASSRGSNACIVSATTYATTRCPIVTRPIFRRLPRLAGELARRPTAIGPTSGEQAGRLRGGATGTGAVVRATAARRRGRMAGIVERPTPAAWRLFIPLIPSAAMAAPHGVLLYGWLRQGGCRPSRPGTHSHTCTSRS